ncbi:MAG: BMP family lipoprotein, partial [Ilumatobacteraceae bacterium]
MIKSKRIAVAAMAAVLALAGAACGSDDPVADEPAAEEAAEEPAAEEEAAEEPAAEEEAAEEPAAEEEAAEEPAEEAGPFLGLAFDTGGRGDGTFNDAAGRGADAAESDLGVAVQELEATSDQDRQPNLEALAGAGNKLVVAVGFAFGDALAPIAEANPDVFFGWIDGYYDGANIITTAFAEHEGSFLVGAAAALKSQTGKIGFIGGQEIDLIKKFEAGYIAGAQAVNPDIVVESSYLGA